MAENDINRLVKRGFIGPVLGAWLSKSNEDGAILGAIIGAAVFATKSAHQKAIQTQQPFLIAENGKLYEVGHSGKKKLIRDLEVTYKHFPLNMLLP